MPSNEEFLNALFGNQAQFVHVTDFPYDPAHIPSNRHLAAWAGDYFSRYRFGQGTNQYFTVSLFGTDEKGKARRRKALYHSTPVIVLDDVKEKLSISEVSKLPPPSWILETSPGSEQWGYILDTPCTDRARVENLLDGLVANGLAPDGKDPGMKGVTRYVRLPEGYNTKASKMVNGQPFKCQITLWQPFFTTKIEELAKPFNVDLDAPRRETRVDGASSVDDHPLLSIPDLIHIKEVRSAGRFDITCPWVDEHTGADDSGSAVFTNGDGSIGFKCHHGACQERTGKDLLQFIEVQAPGFGSNLAGWQAMRVFNSIPAVNVPPPPVSEAPGSGTQENTLDTVVNQLRHEPLHSPSARAMAEKILQVVDSLPQMEKLHWHKTVCDIMGWSKPEFRDILQELRQGWYIKTSSEVSFFDDVIFVAELNQFFDRRKRIFYTAEAYQNTYSHMDPEARKEALQGGMVTKVDKVDYAPLQPPVFVERGITYGNSWSDCHQPTGVPGDVTRWLDHFDALGWSGAVKQHLLQWMAFTVLHPDQKINHMIILGSGEGCGKDYLLYPMVQAMGEHSLTVSGEELLSDFNDYALSTKHLHINEAELGDRREAVAVSNKLKPLAAAPPDKLRVNQKSIKPIQVRNVLSVSMTTNSELPVRLNGGTSRRIFAVWSDLNQRDENDNMLPEWLAYWNDRWDWMKRSGGVDNCIYYLRNCVDLSNFNPYQAPPMTQFLRDIKDASKSPLQQTVEELIRKRVGVFKCDVVTAREATDTLKTLVITDPDLLQCDVRNVTAQVMTSVLKQIQGTFKMHASKGSERAVLHVVRNFAKYKSLTGSELMAEYDEQVRTVTSMVKAVI